MTDLDKFATTLFEEAKQFLEKASTEQSTEGQVAYLHASLFLGFSALEAHVNAIADEFLTTPELTAHERGLLAEKPVDLVHGEFQVGKPLKMYRLEDRIQFLCRRFSTKPIDRAASYWSEFKEAIQLRHSLTHPKAPIPPITQRAVQRALTAILDLLNEIYRRIYKKKYPAFRRGLLSGLTF